MKEWIPARYALDLGGDFWRSKADSPYVTSAKMAELEREDDRYLPPPLRYGVFAAYTFRILGKDGKVLKEGTIE